MSTLRKHGSGGIAARTLRPFHIPSDPTDTDAKLWKLVRSFIAAEDAIYALNGNSSDNEMNRAVDESGIWEWAIANTPVRTPRGLMIKAMIVCDCLLQGAPPARRVPAGRSTLNGKDGDRGIEEVAASSLWHDMVEMFGEPSMIYAEWRPKRRRRHLAVKSKPTTQDTP